MEGKDTYKLDYYYGDEVEHGSFLMVPEFLITNDFYRTTLKNDGIMLYSVMFRRTKLSRKNGWIDELNRVYIRMSIKEVMYYADCKIDKARDLLCRMEGKVGLIERVRDSSGKTERIYLKNYIPPQRKGENKIQSDSVDAGKTNMKKIAIIDDNSFSMGDKTIKEPRNNPLPEVGKTDPSYINLNYTDSVKAININQSADDGKIIRLSRSYTPDTRDTIDTKDNSKSNIDGYIRIIQDNIGYPENLAMFNMSEKRLFEEMYEVMCDLVCSKMADDDDIYINKERKNFGLVKSVFLKLRFENLEYAIRSMSKVSSDVKDMKQYMRTTLYNSRLTVNTHTIQDLKAAGVI